MSIDVQIPSSLRRFTGNEETVRVADACTVAQAVQRLVEQHPALRRNLLTDDGRLYAFVGVFLNSRDIRQLQHADTPVAAGDRITLLPAMAGG